MSEGRKNSSHLEPTVWLKNKYGVISAFPKSIAERHLTTKIGYSLAQPHEIPYVPEQKVYPEELFLTEAGEKRRGRRAQQQAPAAPAPVQAPAPAQELPDVNEPKEADAESLAERGKAGETLKPDEYRALKWLDLRSYAVTRGVKMRGQKREEILADLDKQLGAV